MRKLLQTGVRVPIVPSAEAYQDRSDRESHKKIALGRDVNSGSI